MKLARRDATRHTYGDYLHWPKDVRYELIDGQAYLMAPAPSLDHQEIAGQIYRQASALLDATACRVFVAPVDVLLPDADEADEAVHTVVQPDVLVVCDPTKLDARRVRGAPDWVVEVLSPATAAYDQGLKRAAYERAGVREYWLVHPTDRVVSVYRLQDGAYAKPEVSAMAGETPVGALPGVVIDWARVIRRLPAADGER